MSYPLRRLADLYRKPGPWTTVHLDIQRDTDTQQGGHALDLRWRALREDLERQDAPAGDLETIDDLLETRIRTPGRHVCRFVLVRRGDVVIDEVHYGATPCPNEATCGALPALVPLVATSAHDIPYLVVEAARDGGRVSAYHASRMPAFVDEVIGEALHLSKVPGGGWSQRRYQQTTEEVWRRNAHQVVEDVEQARRRVEPKMIVLSGDVRAREKVAAQLPAEASSLLVEVDVHSLTAGADPSVLDEAVAKRLEDVAEQERQRALRRLGDGSSEGLAVSGLEPVVQALRQAQVHLLVIDFNAIAGKTLVALTGEPWLAGSPGGVTGADTLAEVSAADALLRAGAFTDVRLLPIEGERLEGDEGVAALLRWPI